MGTFKNWLEGIQPGYTAPPPVPGSSPAEIWAREQQKNPNHGEHHPSLLAKREDDSKQKIKDILMKLKEHPEIRATVLRAMQNAKSSFEAMGIVRKTLNSVSPKLYKKITGQSEPLSAAPPPPPTVGGNQVI